MTLGELQHRYAARRKRGGPRPDWLADVVMPLLEGLRERFPKRKLRTFGPGPTGVVCVCLLRKDNPTTPDLSRANCLSITLIPLDARTGATAWRDYDHPIPKPRSPGPAFAEPELGPGTTADDLIPLLEGDTHADEK